MADPALTAPSLARRIRRLPAAVHIAAVYVAARAVTTAFFLLAGALSTGTSRFGLHPSLESLLTGWDAQWYWLIAQRGYPSSLPVDGSGAVVQNPWAFMPVYPYLVRLVGGAGAGWPVAAIAVSVAAGYLSCLVLHRLVRRRIGEAAALWAVVLFANAPLAALFQVGYAESLFLLWLFLALWCLQRRRYALLYPLIALMGFTRPGVLAFALLLGLCGCARVLSRRARPVRAAELAHLAATAAWATVVGLSWPVIAAVATGRPGAYFATEMSWQRGWVPQATSFVPFAGFVRGARFWFGTWGMPAVLGVLALAVAVVAVGVLLTAAPAVRRLGGVVRLWSASYLAYLLAVFFPQTSLFRLLVPLSPLWGAAVPRTRRWRVVVLAGCLLAQWWTYNMYGLGNTFWQIP